MELRRPGQVSSSAVLVRDIERLFQTMDSAGCFVTLDLENARRGIRFVQAVLATDGWMYIESISDEYLDGIGMPLMTAELNALARLGFDRPDSDQWPNWTIRIGPEVRGRIPMLSELAMKTFVDVHDWRPGEPIGAVVGVCANDGDFTVVEAS